jgi:hypothetical protein
LRQVADVFGQASTALSIWKVAERAAANLVATIPGRIAARTPTALLLRAE